MNEEEENNLAKTYRDVGPYLGLGTQLAVTIVALFFLGKWLDEKFEIFPLLTISLSFLGGFAGIYNFIRSVLLINKKNKNEKHS
jgi:F0F1-type ATP synthase assembly protein I